MSELVTRHRDPDRYELTVDDGDAPAVAGFAQFVDRGGRRIFFHTVIDEAFGGRGLGSTLVRAALERTASEGLTIVPVCPFVKTWVEKHPDAVAPVARPTPDDLAVIPTS